MAFQPEPMQRTVIVASKAHEKAIIETLHDMRIAHLNPFTGEGVGDLEGFRLGRPLEAAGRDSEVLVKLRALLRHLDLEEHAPKRTFTVPEIEERLSAAMFDVGQEIINAAESKDRQQQHIERLAEEEQRLRPLQSLPLKLEDYRGYESLTPFVGYVSDPVREDLGRALDQFALFEGENGFIALFVPSDKAQAANDVLFQHGFREHPLPEGTGEVPARLRQLREEREELESRVSRAEATLESLRERHGDFLVAAEEHLTISVAKAEAPLQFAASENAFVVDAWVPVTESRRLEAALDKATSGNVYVEKVPYAGHGMHGVDDIHGGEEFSHHTENEADQPPTRLRNGGPGKHLQYFTEMFSVPKYNELDPTLVLALAFPLFFGFMIGDLGLGLVMAVLGFTMFKKLGHIEGLKELGFAIAFAGVIAAVFGGFVFMDAFGIPLGTTEHIEHKLHEKHVDLTCKNIYKYAHEPTWGCLLGMGAGFHLEPLIAKVTDVNTMLLLSVAAAVVHLFIGLLFGVKNEWGHSVKHTVAKFGWMVLLFTFFAAAVALLSAETWTAYTGTAPTVAYMAAGIGVAIGAVVLGWSEGIAGVLEIPSMFSNILSYLRLGAVAIAKGSMAISFNAMTLVDMTLLGEGIMIVVGIIAFLLVQMLLFVLGVLSSGIQAIRLNYVEFFTKFYKGGGRKFAPFGHLRKYSIPLNAPTTGGGKL